MYLLQAISNYANAILVALNCEVGMGGVKLTFVGSSCEASRGGVKFWEDGNNRVCPYLCVCS